MKKLFRFEDFLFESNIEQLFEANITLSDDFNKVLSDMDDLTANKILNLIGKDVDINTNYIDIDIEKDGFAKFVPDDKVEKIPYIIKTPPNIYYTISKSMGLNNVGIPDGGEEAQIVKRFGKYEFAELWKNSDPKVNKEDINLLLSQFTQNYTPFWYQISFEKEGEMYEILCNGNSLYRDMSSIKSGSLKIGKLATTLLTKAGIDFKPTDIENFVNKYKSIITQIRDKFNNFKIVNGEDIRKSYLLDNYLNMSGSLGNSCMRYDKCQKFLDIYVKNEDKVSLIVLEKEGKVTGRAILWIDYKERKIMDRIYTNNSADEQLFKDFAKANGFWYKKNQDMYEDTPFIGPNGEQEKEILVLLIKWDYRYYPYMDSLKYYDPKTGNISNFRTGDTEYNLTDTDGGNGSCDECGGGGTIECGECDGSGESDCRNCRGNGMVDCDDCDGSGEVECSICDGEANEECDYCNGHGESDCSACDGSGKIEGDDDEEEDCEDCNGSGKESCEHCDGKGHRDCICDSGMVKCRNCNGEGSVECGDCDGNGTTTCDNCDGDGTVNCYQCN
jgi:hypothetical protein